ncbi:hypothetical protein NDU88_002303 [Pleurodeles waltl]|uniref:Uncharacterized protein n=1 Tax=Pleurodeles waltl TaxID=8319 RepID=A0AAV7KT56_PLEWA|nr:hypothetical protein NDU88_002303 [Pleurodeles waltl]
MLGASEPGGSARERCCDYFSPRNCSKVVASELPGTPSHQMTRTPPPRSLSSPVWWRAIQQLTSAEVFRFVRDGILQSQVPSVESLQAVCLVLSKHWGLAQVVVT